MNSTPPTAPNGATPIVAFRQTRGSAPISVDLFHATTDPLAIAFQTTVLFRDPDGGPLTLPQLRARWNASERGARAARRTLIDNGFWVEVDERQADGRFNRRTVFAEIRLGTAELAEIAVQCPPSSRLRCGGGDYLVGPYGELVDRGCISADSVNVSAGRTESAPVQPRSGSTEAASVQARPEQGFPETEAASVQTRPEQGKHSVSADRTESALVQPDASTSSSCKEDDVEKEHACMDAVTTFWKLISASVATVDPRGRSSVRHEVEAALQSGWTADSLAEWARTQITSAQKRMNVRSPGGFVVSVLREIPAVAETTGPEPPKSDLPEWCGECGNPSDPRRDMKCRNNPRMRTWPDGTPCSCRTANGQVA